MPSLADIRKNVFRKGCFSFIDIHSPKQIKYFKAKVSNKIKI